MALADHAQARVVRSGLREAVAQEATDREAVGAATGDGALAADVLEEPHHEHLQIDDRIDAGTPASGRIGVGWLADAPHLGREVHLLQRALDPLVEGIRCGCREFRGRDPHLLLALLLLALLKHSGPILSCAAGGISTGC
jgi:hypothetical protein